MALGNADDAASDDNAPSPFAPSLASFEQHGFVVVRSALDPSVADEVLVHVNTELEKRQELGLEGVEHDVFGAIAPPKSSTSGYGAPVLHRWNLLLDLEHVTKRSLREVLGRSIDQRPPILENEDCQTRTTDVHREFVWSLIQGACGPGAELCDLSALVSDPGSEEQRLHYDTRNDEVDGGDGGIQASAATENIDPVRDGDPPVLPKRLVTGFVALQDVTEDMGPTLIVPKTTTKEVHEEILAAGALSPGKLEAVLNRYQQAGVKCLLAAGDLVLMDSRALHLGSANRSTSKRRVLLDFAFMAPELQPETYCGCILQELGLRRLKLTDYEEWT